MRDIAGHIPAFRDQLSPSRSPGAAPACLFPKVVDCPVYFFLLESGTLHVEPGVRVPLLPTDGDGTMNRHRYKPFSPVWRDTLAQVANLAATYGIFQVFQAQDIPRVRAFLDFWGGRFAHRVRLLHAWRKRRYHCYAIEDKQSWHEGNTVYDPIVDTVCCVGMSGMPSWFIAILDTLATAVNKDAPLA